MRWLFGLTVLVFRGDQEKNAELLVLRHENALLRRHAGRVRYEPADRAWFAALTRFIPRRHSAADQALRSGVHRARYPPDAPGRRHRPPDRRLDGAAGTQPGPGSRRAVRGLPVPDP